MGLDVFTVEILPELADRASSVLPELGLDSFAGAANSQQNRRFVWRKRAQSSSVGSPK